MSDAWNGVPENPERDGWHWVLVPMWSDAPVAQFWHGADQTWGEVKRTKPAQVAFWTYLGPCALPSEVAALRAALDAAKADNDAWHKAGAAMLTARDAAIAERDAAQAALMAAQARAGAAEHALNMERARVHECRTIQREMARDIQTLQPPAALVAAERERDEADRRAGAAERRNEQLREDAFRRSQWLRKAKEDAGYDDNVSFDVVWRDALAAIRALQPPADLAAQAAQAPGDAVARRPACPHSRVDCGIGQLMTKPPLPQPLWICDAPGCSMAFNAARAGA